VEVRPLGRVRDWAVIIFLKVLSGNDKIRSWRQGHAKISGVRRLTGALFHL
jgi:hypothetical protein